MKRILVFCIVLVVSTSIALAKRSVPAKVVAIKSGGIEYRAPQNQIGCVEAWETKRNQLIWRRQIYVVKYTIGLERDVQDVFIKTMQLKDSALIIKNERKS